LRSPRRNCAPDFIIIILKEIMTNYKDHCTRYLSNRLRGSSDWRRAQGTKFPADTRNDKASSLRLLELESLIEISDLIWTRNRAVLQRKWQPLARGSSDTNRDIGFRRHHRRNRCSSDYHAHQKIAPETSRPKAAMHRETTKPTPQNSATTLKGLTSARASLALASKTVATIVFMAVPLISARSI
jgi:hypothetical protein